MDGCRVCFGAIACPRLPKRRLSFPTSVTLVDQEVLDIAGTSVCLFATGFAGSMNDTYGLCQLASRSWQRKQILMKIRKKPWIKPVIKRLPIFFECTCYAAAT
jgi:hypothetical protein